MLTQMQRLAAPALAGLRCAPAAPAVWARSMATRTETDAFGAIELDGSKLWGAQTQRSIQNFPIGGPAARMPGPVVTALGVLKKCCAAHNVEAGKMDVEIGTQSF